MNKQITLGRALLLCVLIALIGFQVTFLAMKIRYSSQLKQIQAEYSQGLRGQLAGLDHVFREYYAGTVDEEKMSEALLKSYVSMTGDRYAEYLTKDELETLLADHSSDSVGIGVQLQYDAMQNRLDVLTVPMNSPADEAGLRPGDHICAVDGKSVKELGCTAALRAMQGASDSRVTLTVLRGDSATPLDITVVRKDWTQETLRFRVTEAMNLRIGVIALDTFDSNGPEAFSEALQTLMGEGVQALIFDLRSCSGGDAEYAAKMLDKLLPECVLYRVYDAQQKETVRNSDASEVTLPMAVLVDGHTAGAAEIFAAALRDYDRAAVIGTQTYGKGSAQTMLRLPSGAGLRVTSYRYLPPRSDSFDGKGLTPDYVVEPGSELLEKGLYRTPEQDDNQFQTAVSVLAEP